MVNSELVTEQEKIANDVREAIISLFYLVIFIGSIITFSQWFRSAYFSLGLLSYKIQHYDAIKLFNNSTIFKSFKFFANHGHKF